MPKSEKSPAIGAAKLIEETWPEEAELAARLRRMDREHRAMGRAAIDAAIAWACCASIHREYAKGRDALFTTRQADYVKSATKASRLAKRTERRRAKK